VGKRSGGRGKDRNKGKRGRRGRGGSLAWRELGNPLSEIVGAQEGSQGGRGKRRGKGRTELGRGGIVEV